MPAPIILISNQRIKPGKLDAYQANYAGAVERFRTTRPQTLLHSAYLGSDGKAVTVIMVFQDADAMEEHMRGLAVPPRSERRNRWTS